MGENRKGSIKRALDWATKMTGLTMKHRSVLGRFLWESHSDGRVTVTHLTLAEPLGTSTKTIQRHALLFQEKGLIKRLSRGTNFDGKNRPNVYRLCDGLQVALGRKIGSGCKYALFSSKCPPDLIN